MPSDDSHLGNSGALTLHPFHPSLKFKNEPIEFHYRIIFGANKNFRFEF
jgi:hypothetical protein